MKELFTVRKAFVVIRAASLFVIVFDSINVALVLISGAYNSGLMPSFLRWGMTIPASLCTMCNAAGVLLLSFLMEKLYVRPPNGQN